jgi:hypothetical protein
MYDVEYNICQISFNGNFTQKNTKHKKKTYKRQTTKYIEKESILDMLP